ncbi:twin-arginine translocation signal domain-containing protein [bacterium]|nr:twin-arginine translocation signal domain-containing protein [bacterium]
MSKRSQQPTECQTPDCCCSGMSRRDFLAAGSAAAAALPIIAGPFTRTSFAAELDPAHLVPVDKNLTAEWTRSLTARGEPTVWSGDRLTVLGMPCGGIGAGQMYVTGDGTLACWHIYNHTAPLGRNNQGYQASQLPGIRLQQGYAVRIKPKGGKTVTKRLDKTGFPNVAFIGQYPISRVLYRDESLPVKIEMAAFSPFIPLNALDSALPATIMEFTLKNTSAAPVEVSLAGWLENPVGVATVRASGEGRRKQTLQQMDVRTDIAFSGLPTERKPEIEGEVKEPEVFADFEAQDYQQWKAEGRALGSGPAQGTLSGQQRVTGFVGKGLVNTYAGGDDTTGRLISPEFTITRPYINFLVGGGADEKKVYIRLLVGGKEVVRAAGRDDEALTWRSWNVRKHLGKKARIEIVDDAMGSWGHLNVDQITFADRPHRGPGEFERQQDYGTVRFSLLDGADAGSVDVGEAVADEQLSARGVFGKGKKEIVYDLPEVKCASLCKNLSLAPGEEKRVRFALAWHFPIRRWAFPHYEDLGNYYATRFSDAGAVMQYLAANYERLASETRLYCKTYYDDSTLPHWFLSASARRPPFSRRGRSTGARTAVLGWGGLLRGHLHPRLEL